MGVILTKNLLDILDLPSPTLHRSSADFKSFRPRMKEMWTDLDASMLMESTFFIPEKMSTWDALQVMRKKRVHMAIVVDEYGGTSGLISFEDILEEARDDICFLTLSRSQYIYVYMYVCVYTCHQSGCIS